MILKNIQRQLWQTNFQRFQTAFKIQLQNQQRANFWQYVTKKGFEYNEKQKKQDYSYKSLKSEKFKEKKNQKDQVLQQREEQLEKEQLEKEKQQEEEQKWEGKEKFIQQIRKQRQEIEQEEEKKKKQIQFDDQRMKRINEVQTSKLDYQKLMTQNINLIPVANFRNVEELFYFISNLRVQLTEENIIKCVNGFVQLSNQMNEELLQSLSFKEFVEVVQKNINLISIDDNLLLIVQFSDIFCLDNTFYWESLERKMYQKFNSIEINLLIQMVSHFSNQKEGSDFFYDNFEQIIKLKIDDIQFSKLVLISQSYFKVQKGTVEFFNFLMRSLENRILDHANTQDITRLAFVFKNSKQKDKNNFFQLLEEKAIALKNDINFDLACLMGEGFGFEFGSENLLKVLEKIVLKKEFNEENLPQIIKGFILSYKGSNEIFDKVKDVVMSKMINEIALKDAAALVKAYHIAEKENKFFNFQLEKVIVQRLKNVQNVTIQEIFDVVKTYTVTRNGSRELYKMLEIIIKFRFEEIILDADILKGIYVYYTKSGLCSTELIQKMEVLI